MTGPAKAMEIVVDKRVAATARALGKGLGAHSSGKVGSGGWKRFSFSIRGEEGAIRGGLVGLMVWNWCFVEMLWIEEGLRQSGLGSELLAKAEALAAKRGARHIYLDTFSFQAEGFYKKLGYEVFGELGDFPPGHRRIWLKKDLS